MIIYISPQIQKINIYLYIQAQTKGREVVAYLKRYLTRSKLQI